MIVSMKDAQEKLQAALSHYRSGQPHVAEEMYREVLTDDPTNVLSLHMLGIITNEAGRYAESAAFLNQAIQVKRNDPLLFFTLGLTLQRWGKLDEAVLEYKKAIGCKPDYIDAYLRMADIFKSQGNPDLAETYQNLGLVFNAQQKFDEAIEIFKRAISIKPDYIEAHFSLGNAFKEQGKFDEAIAHYSTVIAFRPDLAEPYNNLGLALNDQEKYDEAIEMYKKAIAIKPDFVEAHFNMGSVLQDLDQLDRSIASFRRALEINPRLVRAHSHMGSSLRQLGRLDEAVASYRRALEIKPDDSISQFGLGMTLLKSGIFSEGWQKYESRWEGSLPEMQRPATRLPQWTGQNISPDDRILLLPEQGWGDKLQFSRYIPLVAERFAGRVTVVVDRPLLGLFRRSFPDVEFLEEIYAREDTWQWYSPLLSLPLAFNTVLGNIPGQSPYLVPDPARTAYWKSKIADLGLPPKTRKIGLVWKSGRGMKIAPLKTLAMLQLAPLLEQENCAWISLQKEPDPDSAAWIASGKLIDWTDQISDFDDTAALMMNLDLIISVDTSVAHLAGGLGLPTWLFNRHASDWRWMWGREDSPWYPSMRIFTQEIAGDWNGVVRRMVTALSESTT